MRICVTGAGGAIGGHLVKALLADGHRVRAVDIKKSKDWWQIHPEAENWMSCDLSITVNALRAVEDMEWVYDLSEHMGGISFITHSKVECAESILIGIELLRASALLGVSRFFFASSACVYPTHIQKHRERLNVAPVLALREDQAWPALPEEGYGFSKLYMEELCSHYAEDYELEVRIARYHNIFGPPCSWGDGKEKSPAALCRKVAEAVLTDRRSVEMWGDGRQIRSYLHVSDCVAGTIALMESDHTDPINIGSDRAVTLNQLLTIVQDVAGVNLHCYYDPHGPQGVDARNADISLVKDVLGWEPKITLEDGIAELYHWIKEQVNNGPLGSLSTSASRVDNEPMVATIGGSA